MAKTFKVYNSGYTDPPQKTDWELCLICQEKTKEPLRCPLNVKGPVNTEPYKNLADNLLKLDNLKQLPVSLQIARLDEGQGVEHTFISNEAKYHKTCRMLYNNQMLQRAEKRACETDEQHDIAKQIKIETRSSFGEINKSVKCFFCGEPAGSERLHEAATFQIDEKVRKCAVLLNDTKLLAQLSGGDMVALEAKYHSKCLASLYNRARAQINETSAAEGQLGPDVASMVFAELVMYIEEVRMGPATAPVFKLAELVQLYASRMEQLGVPLTSRLSSTRLKERLLTQFTDMHAVKSGRDVLLCFDDDIGTALTKACELDTDQDAVHLARAAKIVRREMFANSKPFTGFSEEYLENSTSPLLLTLIKMILQGPTIKDQMEGNTPAALTIAHMLKYNSVKRRVGEGVRHSNSQETATPIYIGLMLHAHTRKKELIDKLSHLGVCISYDRVLSLSAEMGNRVCTFYRDENVVCPPIMRGNVFTTAAVDNVDHNPSSTTAKNSFHGTSISLFQHLSSENEGVSRNIVTSNMPDCASKTIFPLPSSYTDVFPVNSNVKTSSVPSSHVQSLSRPTTEHIKHEFQWLDHVRSTSEQDGDHSDLSWAAYHASQQQLGIHATYITSLLPLFLENAHSVAMIRHSMDVIRNAIYHLHPQQIPVIAFDQPLFALAKQIQWKWPEQYGDIVILFGGLHIEMAFLRTLGDWLKGSGWVEAIVQAGISTIGTADSFLKVTHVSRTKRAHQVTVAALYILQHAAYDHYINMHSSSDVLSFDEWCSRQKETIPQFQYWATVMELELSLLVFERSLRLGSFQMYLDALTDLTPWFFALDHTNYARWIPVHLRDMAELPTKYPQIYKEFLAGRFVVQKTKRSFSAIPIDQAHEQNNARVKGDGGAIGLLDNPSALRRWMVAGPEVAGVIQEFEEANQSLTKDRVGHHHHDQSPGVQKKFAKDVHSLVKVMQELGNPFEEESRDIIALDSKEIANPCAVKTVQKAHQIGKDQFKAFTLDRLVNRTKSIHDPINHNKLKVFQPGSVKNPNSSQQKFATLRNDMELFSRLYIGCQNRDGNLDEFFRHENQPCPPAFSENGMLSQGTKSDLLFCLEEGCPPKSEAPDVSCIILDGAAVVQFLKPTGLRKFAEYAYQVFLPYISSCHQKTTRVDLVWDRYFANSIKSTARAKRGKGIRRRVCSDAVLPANWQSFLRVDQNKMDLFEYLSDILIKSFEHGEKQLVITQGGNILCKPQLPDICALSPCNHEEADTRMILHASHAAQHGHQKIMIRTVDTDVVVLAVSVVQSFGDTELWVGFGTGKNFRHIAAHEIAHSLGPEKARALPMFHAFTGCDSVSSFVGHGKKSAWGTWKVLPELTQALLDLCSAPSNIPPHASDAIERFTVLLYDRTSACESVNLARKKLFSKRHSVHRIPPTSAALEQHLRRAAYQGGHVWGQLLLPSPHLPCPSKWGWVKTEDGIF